VIGKADWFQRRKYLGWGIYPKKWQGWVYILVFILLVVIVQLLPFFATRSKLIITTVLVAILLVDVVHIMLTMKKDERETKHEAIADRNALWVMLGVLVVGILYQTISATLKGQIPTVDYFLIAALLASVIAKGLTNLYLDKKD
jgi:membrane protease YdiL (CAAX protease family)